ncbi:MAG: type II restriction endonuclease [Deltaproteobacteria bacterium]|nr:type II restriction endonuclease [Deltaproteobacteria bacterium]
MNRRFDFFVDWQKIKRNVERYKIEISLLNSLIGSKNIRFDFSELIKKYPEVLPVLPLIIAVRDAAIHLIGDNELTKTFHFTKRVPSNSDLKDIIFFADRSGILNLFSDFKIKDLRDYLLGVEVGMDTNARKNRSGYAMELAAKPYIESLKKEIPDVDIEFFKTFKYIGQKYKINIPKNLLNRKTDYVVRKGKTFINIEVNYFDGQGSKPQEIVDSYINRQNELYEAGWKFIWVTDGRGWKDGINQITKGFSEIDYLLNLSFAKKGLLNKAVLSI